LKPFDPERANPEAARRLGVSHVRGILLSGPPGCGKTLLARELSEMLGAREPKIVNGPEILDKFIGAAEKNIRDLFEPAEREYEQLGDESALHVIVFDELDSIARRRGSVSGDTTGVRDSVVNQLLAKMDGVKEANNILVIGMTNRPELLDPALTRPGRLEVQLRVELPDALGRRDILRIHTRRMKEQGAISWEALQTLEDVESEGGIPGRTEYFTGAELAGLVRSAASFALARTVKAKSASKEADDEATVTVRDLEQALTEIRPALGKQDEVLEARFPYGISPCSPAMQRIMRDLERFTSTPDLLAKQHLTPADSYRTSALSWKFKKSSSTLQSLLLVGDGYKGGTGATALACWAASQASEHGEADYVRLITSLDLLTSGGGDESARATALVERFAEAASMSNSLLVFDDIDQVCAGSGPDGYSSLMLSTLRALLRSPTAGVSSSRADTQEPGNDIVEKNFVQQTRSLSVLAATSRTDAVCSVLHELFDETLVVPVLSDVESIKRLLSDSVSQMGAASADISVSTVSSMAEVMVNRLQTVGCKTALRLLERAVAMSYRSSEDHGIANKDPNSYLSSSLASIIDDYVRDEAAAGKIACKVK
jgi:vesicle-fusing ATPase